MAKLLHDKFLTLPNAQLAVQPPSRTAAESRRPMRINPGILERAAASCCAGIMGALLAANFWRRR